MSFHSGAVRAAHARFLAAHDDMLRQELQLAGSVATQHARTKAGFKTRTGRLQAGTRARVARIEGGLHLRLINAVPWARIIESGSKAHVIRPRIKSVLRFVSGGRLVFAKQVNHRGTKPYRFLSLARDAASKSFESRIGAAFGKLSSRF